MKGSPLRPLFALILLWIPVLAWADYCPPRVYHARHYHQEHIVIAAFQFLPTVAVPAYRPSTVGGPAPGGNVAAAAPNQAAPTGRTEPLGILKHHCGKCHSGATAKGDVRLFSGEGAFAPSIPKTEILAAITENRMPQGVKKDPKLKLSQAEINVLTEWSRQ